MNIAQLQSVLNILDKLEKLDVEKKLVEEFPTESNPAKVNIGHYNGEKFLSFFYRLVAQFKVELKNDALNLLLPFQYNFNNEFGNGNLESDLTNLFNHVNSKNLSTAEGWMNRLIYYQMVHGFWDRSSVNVHNLRGINASKLENKLKFIEESLDVSIKSNKELTKHLKKQKEDLDLLVNEKRQQFNEINNIFSSAQSQGQQVSSILNNSNSHLASIEKFLNQQESNLTKTKENIAQYSKEYKELQAAITSVLDEAGNRFETIEKHLEYVSSKKEFIEEKEREIIKLTGKAADGVLGHTFFTRKNMLNWSTWIWLVILVAIVIGSGFWIHFVFTNLSANTGTAWVDLLINTVKASPALILVGFAINQYSKERSLKEEYAFKAAVAMTINAYADEISKAFKDKDESRERMILESIQKVYLPPKFYQENNGGLFSNGSKELNETLKVMSETLKELKK